MRLNEGKTLLVVTAVGTFIMLAGCASLPSEVTTDELSAEWLAEARP